MRISDLSSDVCSSDLWKWKLPSVPASSALKTRAESIGRAPVPKIRLPSMRISIRSRRFSSEAPVGASNRYCTSPPIRSEASLVRTGRKTARPVPAACLASRSEEHTSELQSLMHSSYAVFCLKKKKIHKSTINKENIFTYSHRDFI